MNELTQIIKTNELDSQDGQIIIDRFGSYEAIANEWQAKAKSIVVTRRDQTTEMAMAREARRKFSQMRIDLEKTRKAIGEPAFRKYKAVNAVAKYLQSLIEPIESYLLEQEEFTKRDDARIEAEKIVAEERRIETERLAKEEAERKEQERIRLENEKLKKEAEEREALIVKEREEARKKQEAIEKKALEEKTKLEEKARLEREEAETERKRLEKVLEDKKAEDEKRQKEEAEAERQRLEAIKKSAEEASKATDEVKYQTYIKALMGVESPQVKDEGISSKISNIREFLEKC